MYSRGGIEAEQEDHDVGSKAWLRSLDDMWQQPSNSLLTAKLLYLF